MIATDVNQTLLQMRRDLIATRSATVWQRPEEAASDELPMPVEVTAADIESMVLVQNIARLSDLQFDHMRHDWQVELLDGVIGGAEQWKQQHIERPGLSFIMLSGRDRKAGTDGYGCGKTHIAKALFWSRAYVVQAEGSIGGKQSLTPDRAIFFRARELMAKFDEADYALARMIPRNTRVVVIDDVGREGTLRYEKRDPETQAAERRNRYFSVIDYCYDKRISVVMSSNCSMQEFRAVVGEVSMDRLQEMAPKGFMWDMTGLPSVRKERSGRY